MGVGVRMRGERVGLGVDPSPSGWGGAVTGSVFSGCCCGGGWYVAQALMIADVLMHQLEDWPLAWVASISRNRRGISSTLEALMPSEIEAVLKWDIWVEAICCDLAGDVDDDERLRVG